MSESAASRIADEIMGALEGGPAVLVATVIAGPPTASAGAKLLLRRDGSTLSSLGEAALDRAIAAEAGDAFRRGGVSTLYLRPDGSRLSRTEAGSAASYQVMLEVHEQPARLLIMGGGHVGKALSLIGSMCGFRITVVDDRPEYANRERFPEADEVIRGRFDEVLAECPIDAATYVVCVTRGHRHDEVSLRAVVGRGARYVGMIGSRRRAGAVLQHLVEDGADAEAVAAVRTPIGLDVGAETPEEIAVAIMAEIIQVRRGGSGRPLSESRRPKGKGGS